MERWKSVKGYEGIYEVSDRGRVRSLDREVKNRYSTRLRRGRILKPVADRAGYMQVRLSDGIVGTGKVHRLVAEAFLPKPPTKRQVNHLNFDKADNRVCNLAWCTPKQNHRHAVDAGRLDGAISPKRGKKLTVSKVLRIRSSFRDGNSSADIAKRFDIAAGTVRRILAGKIWVRV